MVYRGVGAECGLRKTEKIFSAYYCKLLLIYFVCFLSLLHLAVNRIRIHRADYTMSNSVNSRLSLQLRGTKPPVESSKRNSVPSKLPGVAEGNSSPRPLSKLPVINSPSTKSGSGGGPSVAANSPAPITRDKSTPPSSPPVEGRPLLKVRSLRTSYFQLKIALNYSRN